MLELNGAQPSDKGCRLTFVVTNNLGARAVEGRVRDRAVQRGRRGRPADRARFQGPAGGKTKVARFDLAGTDCAKISRVLINTATECAGAGIEPAACLRDLKTTTKTQIAFGV